VIRPVVRPTHSVFLSYAREDLRFAHKVAAALEAAGHSVAMDVTDVVPGDAWQERLDHLLRGAAKMVFLATPASVQSSACARELVAALAEGKPVLPILPVGMPRDLLPPSLRRLNYTRLSDDDDLAAGILALSNAITLNLDWERSKAAYLLRTDTDDALLHGRKELTRAETWALARPSDAAPIPAAVSTMLTLSRQRLTRRDQLAMLGLALVATVFLGLGLLTMVQWQRQVQATAQVEVEAALRAARPAEALLDQGRQLEALALLRDAVGTLTPTGAVTRDMHVALRSALRNVHGQRRIGIADDLVALDLGGHLLLHRQEDGLLHQIGPDGLLPTSVTLPGRVVAWEIIPELGTGVIARIEAGQLLMHPFDPTTLKAGPILATQSIREADAAHVSVTMGPDGLVLVNTYAEAQAYYFEGPHYAAPVESWAIDLASGTSIVLPEGYDLLMNGQTGQSYVVSGWDNPELRFNAADQTLVAHARTEGEVWSRDAFYTCFRHHLDHPDIELFISRMMESYKDDISSSSFGLVPPECRFVGEWLLTLTGRASQSGLWKDIAIYDQESLLDRDDSWRREGLYSLEDGAAQWRYVMLQGTVLPDLSARGGGWAIAGFDGRDLFGSFGKLQNDTPLVAATLVNDSLGAWVEAPVAGRQRELILIDLGDVGDPFVGVVDNPAIAEVPEPHATETDVLILSDGSRFTVDDQKGLRLDGWDMIPVSGEPMLIASNWEEEVFRVFRGADGVWQREVLFIAEMPVSMQAISGDGRLAVVVLGGATLGSNAFAVISVAEGTVVETIREGSGGDFLARGASDFIEDRSNDDPANPMPVFLFPDYAGYGVALDEAILRLCGDRADGPCSVDGQS
jgi:hypothetical protein